MGYLKYLKQAFQKPTKEQAELQRKRLVDMRQQPVTSRLEKPTRLDRARALGYKAKKGFIVIRQRVTRGSHTRPEIRRGRRPKRFHQRKDLSKNYQQIAEEKAGRTHKNCEVLGSYLVAQDGKHSWYEIILIDRLHPQVVADSRVKGVAKRKGKAQRGLTSAGRKARGLRKKGEGSEKTRPSLRANTRRH